MDNPYVNLPESAFWRTAVAARDRLEIDGLWQPVFPITRESRIATFGSCFAQHFSRALIERGFQWFDAEPGPAFLSAENQKKFNFGVFSARTGNIYTSSLLKQWMNWTLGVSKPPEEYWEKDGRIYDPFRPNIEPDGFESVEEMLESRQATLVALHRVVRNSDILVFTLGLTESWFNKAGEYEYPTCPGTIAGEFSDEDHAFVNQSFETIKNDLHYVLNLLKRRNLNIKILLTVSPVPLTATASGKHVLVATMASKSILRAVAETVTTELDFVDYFPSYEIINSPAFKGGFFKANMRQVDPAGVSFVMDSFFRGLGEEGAPLVAQEPSTPVVEDDAEDLLVCEEELLEAFAVKGGENA